MSDQGSPADYKREKSEERLTADHQSVSAKEPLLLQARYPKDKRKKRISQKKKLGQPAGKPKKVKPIKRKK